MLFLYFSSYPDQRVKKDPDDLEMGVIGSVSLLQNANLSTQPITSFDWSPDKVSRADPENSERGAGTLATLPPCTVPCKMVLASPADLDTCPNHFNLRFFTVVKISS